MLKKSLSYLVVAAGMLFVTASADPEVIEFHTYTGTASGAVLAVSLSQSTSFPFDEDISFVVGDDRSFVFSVKGRTFQTDIKKNGNFSGSLSFDIIDGLCNVTVDVAGSINGKNASGTLAGSGPCGDFVLTLNSSTFTANSPTEPNYLDTRNQPRVAVIPMGDGFIPIVIPAPDVPEPPANSGFLDEAIDKPIVWNQGWDTNIGHRTQIDPSVQIKFNGFTTAPFGPNGGYRAISWTPNARIVDWGEQTYFNPQNHRIYAKAVLLIDRGATVQGGAFEWVLDDQNFVIEHNMFRPGTTVGWLTNWYNSRPRSGDKVWFFLLSDDERFSSSPVSFIWP